jgi:hypothetical protein
MLTNFNHPILLNLKPKTFNINVTFFPCIGFWKVIQMLKGILMIIFNKNLS